MAKEKIDLSTEEGQEKFEAIPEGEREKLIQKAESEARIINEIPLEVLKQAREIGEEQFVEGAVESVLRRGQEDSNALSDVFVNPKEKAIASLITHQSWGDTPGIERSVHLDLKSGDNKTDFSFSEVRHGESERYDMPEFDYRKIESLKFREGFFFVKFFTPPDPGKWHLFGGWWKIPANKSYMLGRFTMSDHRGGAVIYGYGPIVQENLYDLEISTVEKGITKKIIEPNVPGPLVWRKRKELEEKYPGASITTACSRTPESFSEGKEKGVMFDVSNFGGKKDPDSK